MWAGAAMSWLPMRFPSARPIIPRRRRPTRRLYASNAEGFRSFDPGRGRRLVQEPFESGMKPSRAEHAKVAMAERFEHAAGSPAEIHRALDAKTGKYSRTSASKAA